MKKLTGLSLVLAVFAAVIFLSGFQSSEKEPMRHIVVFKYKPSATPAQIEQVTQAFGELKDKIPGITAYEHGVNDSPENKNLGFTHVYQLTFEDAAARDNYLPHPEHKKFGALLGQLNVLEDAFVVDYAPAKSGK
ncbi:Dabb family protein [Pontibacter diazotrophicus]|uniref:Dabb family protein n=1 Tax=Pontibacter diazotrophicus TaxID=1400979 RepID=A0A3D8L708_9BACT|nr:Dabb family protein [Pontibacter diazotrophicus]RDV13076.1 Dabb family protein [Pontibacter diazotrophicus]